MKELAAALFLVLVGLVLFAWVNDWPPSEDRMPLYMGQCSHVAPSHELCKTWALVGVPGSMVVNKELGVVVFEVMSAQISEEGCVIQNARNWRCRDGTQVIAGKLQEKNVSNAPTMIQMPKWKWLKLKYWDKVPAAEPR